MAWSSPRTWVSGELVTASIMNVYIRDNQNLLKTAITDSGQVEFANSTELTIASGAITPTQNLHSVDTQGDAASDDLDTITVAGDVSQGFILTLQVADPARTVVLKTGTSGADNLDIGPSDITLDESYTTQSLIYDGTNWKTFSYATSPTFASLSPLTTRGDTLVATSGTVTGTRLAIGSANTYLKSDATDATWAAAPTFAEQSPLTTRGDTLVATSGTVTGARLAIGSANTYLKSDATDATWAAAPTFAEQSPLTTRGDLLVSTSGTVTGTRLAVGGANEVLTSDGTDAAWAAAAAGGKVLQVHNFAYTAQVGSTSSTFATTNVLDTITLADSDNKCLVMVDINGVAKSGGTSVSLRIQRAISGGATTTVAGGNIEATAAYTASTTTNYVGSCSFQFLDDPTTTSELTYTVEFANASNASNTYVMVGNSRGSITLMEIEV
jgi:hypothetical protein